VLPHAIGGPDRACSRGDLELGQVRVAPGAIFTKDGSNAIVPPSVPLLSNLTPTSAAKAVPADAKLAATIKGRQFLYVSAPFGMALASSMVLECRYPLPPGGSLSQRNAPTGSVDISGVDVVVRHRDG